MKASHAFDLQTSPDFVAIEQLLRERFALDPVEAAKTQHDFELELRRRTAALERRIHEEDFTRLDVDVPGIVVDDIRYRRVKDKSTGTYMTIAGKIRLKRTMYRTRGGHGGKSISALEMRLGLVGGHWTPASAEMAATFMASVPSDESARLLAMTGGMAPSSSHIDRLPKLVSETWDADRERFEAGLREAERDALPAPSLVALIMISLDGIMLPMKDAPRTKDPDKLASGPKGHREVGCGTASLYDSDGKRLHTIRFGRMPEKKKVTLQRQLTAELGALVERYPHARVQAVADGARENWRILDEVATEVGVEMEEVLDYWHCVEHVSAGLRRAGLKQPRISELCVALRDDEHGLADVIEELAYQRTCFSGRRHDDIERELNYVLNHDAQMEYPTLQKEHRPIGSGVQEAACKSLVADRMKRSGMSWLKRGGQGVLTLRSLERSNRRRAAWELLRPTFRRDYRIDEDHGRQRPRLAAA